MNNGKGFSKSANQPNEMAFTICTSISRNCFWLMRDWKLESLANEKEMFCSQRKKRSTSEVSGKLPYHLTSKRNFRIFSPNGKHPRSISTFSASPGWDASSLQGYQPAFNYQEFIQYKGHSTVFWTKKGLKKTSLIWSNYLFVLKPNG